MAQPLTPKMQRFVDAYLETWNGTRAAEAAGFKWPTKAAWRLLKLPHIREALSAKLDESAMPANEVLSRLAQQARASMGDFYIVEDGFDPKTGEMVKRIGINWDLIKEKGYLVKRISYSKRGDPIIELHDPQNALVQLGRAHGLFKDLTELTGRDGGPLTWKEFVEKDDQPEASDL
jgi:hypothetical protein